LCEHIPDHQEHAQIVGETSAGHTGAGDPAGKFARCARETSSCTASTGCWERVFLHTPLRVRSETTRTATDRIPVERRFSNTFSLSIFLLLCFYHCHYHTGLSHGFITFIHVHAIAYHFVTDRSDKTIISPTWSFTSSLLPYPCSYSVIEVYCK
jgi:hypothetical protein